MVADPRLLKSFAIAPLVTLPVTGTVFAIWFARGWPDFIGQFGLGVMIGSIGLLWAYPLMLFVGIPVTLAIRRLRLFGPATMAVTGAVVGALPFFVDARQEIRLLRMHHPDAWSRASDPLMFLTAGTLSGLICAYLVWRRTSGLAS